MSFKLGSVRDVESSVDNFSEFSNVEDGRYERNFRAAANASSSDSTSSSIEPFRAWIRLPPRLSLSTSSIPNAFTTGGPATKS